MEDEKKSYHCSFCGKSEEEVDGLLKSPYVDGTYICQDCTKLSLERFRQNEERMRVNVNNVKRDDVAGINLMAPHKIKKLLDQYVVGQDNAKKVLSVAVYNHYKRVINKDTGKYKDVDLDKSNILMLGPTGSGKTLLAKTLAEIINVPFVIADATSMTQAGYVGEDVENMLANLIRVANDDVKRAQKGIIYIDEIDKIAKKANISGRDASGEGVQQSLLKIIEGTVAHVPPKGGKKIPNQDFITIDTKDILFICGGAFVELEKIVDTRQNSSSIGFDSNIEFNSQKYSQKMSNLLPEDFVQYGLIPEFVGRLPIVVVLDPLTERDLTSILIEPKNALIKQLKKLLHWDGVELEFEEAAIKAVAKLALERGTGARGLKSIVENAILNLMYDIPSDSNIKKVIITEDCILGIEAPLIIRDAVIES
ncbi:MAG TPA: ATP-dependent Clp protease ATP-binding subunit ClpX [Clostridia bacterium]|jgi:ATP-dependent Clp protease ATP-binding subunit ClpX|nr:ATP-dependent Clp protease ATP-binding subunit ClpX [Clostridia bacterium]